MAVQGATPKSIIPAIYCFASSGETKFLKKNSKNKIPSIAIVNGLTIQLIISVITNPFGAELNSLILRKSIFIIIGKIMSQISRATSKFTFSNSKCAIELKILGNI